MCKSQSPSTNLNSYILLVDESPFLGHSISFNHFEASAKGKPEITVGLEPITVRAGEPFELRAQVKGQPTPMVQWMKGKLLFT